MREWRAWAGDTRSFDALAAVRRGPLLHLDGRMIPADFVSVNYFDLLGTSIPL